MSKGSVVIIAEAGVNHNGSLQMAKALVDAAAEAGVDYVKFQTFRTEDLVTTTAKKAQYQQKNTGEEDESQFRMLKKLELSVSDHEALIDYCKERGVKFLSTAFDLQSIDLLRSLGIDIWKIPSGEITNYPYLRKIAGYNQDVILSTGMSTEADISAAIDVLTEHGQDLDKVTLLHCNTQYPTPYEDVNLKAMVSMRKFTGRVGYSDHTKGIEVPIAAVALGAEIIEKHFTLSKDLPGPDHKASLEPSELSAMVKSIRHIEKALGDCIKKVTDSERNNIEIARKSIVASCPIRKGEIFSDENLTTKRPGSGISPMRWKEVIGKSANRDFAQDEEIEI